MQSESNNPNIEQNPPNNSQKKRQKQQKGKKEAQVDQNKKVKQIKKDKESEAKTINNQIASNPQITKGFRKDEQSLLRLNYLYQAANLYRQTLPELSQYFIKEMVQVSQKKIIRIDKQIKKKICKNCCRFKSRKEVLKIEKKAKTIENMAKILN